MENYRLEQEGQEVQDILNGAAMQTDLTAEVERAEGAEQTLQGNIDEEERRAKAAEETLSGAIGDEELRAKAAEEALGGAIDDINAKIPAAASSENKLADQDFVNSSIETATATFRGTYNLVSDLHLAVDATHEQIATLLGTVIAEADNNDYSYVLVPTSAQTPTEIASIEKYTFGANGWAFAYALNNSGFTSAQWSAINSGITSGLVAKLNALPTNTDLLALLAGKQDVLTFDNVPVEGSNNPVKSGGVHSAIDDEKTARVNAVNGVAGRVDTIEGEIPAQASSENQLADKAYVNSSISTNTATYRGSFNLVADLGLSVSATHEQIGTALAGEISTADNNDYAYVQVPTSDETPSQILKVERYKYNGTAWAFEYELNNSGFTSAEWAAINSGITSGLVGKLNALPTNDELTLALAGKQDVLTFDNTPTENSNNPVKSGGVYAADKALSDAIEAILLLIPSAATSLNKLVDTDLMNSSISTATATFRGTFNLVSDLSLDLTATHAQIATALAGEISTADNNDYCFVQIPTAIGTPTEIAQTDRYKFNGTAWAFEYTLNNSGFTASQWAAINSAITTELVAKLTALPTNAELLESLGLLSSGISGINAKIPSAASSENKLVDGTAMETYVAQIVNAIDATFNMTSTDGHVTLAITQENGVITSVQLTTSDIASAAALNLKASQADLTALAGRVTTAEGNITSLGGRVSTNETDIANLQQLYNNLQQSKPVPVTALPSTGQQQGVIYRLAGTTSYSDYMWNGSTWVLMATYNNAVDAVPTKGSHNLVESGGVYNEIGRYSDKINLSETKQMTLTQNMVLLWEVETELNIGDEFLVSVLGTFEKSLVRIYANNTSYPIYEDNSGSQKKLVAEQVINKLLFYANCTTAGDAVCTLKYTIPSEGLKKNVEKCLGVVDSQYLLHCIAGGKGPSLNDWNVNDMDLFSFNGNNFTAYRGNGYNPDIHQYVNVKAGKRYYVLCELNISALHTNGVTLTFVGLQLNKVEAHLGKNVILFDTTIDSTSNIFTYLQFSPNGEKETGDLIITAELLYFSIIEAEDVNVSYKVIEQACVKDVYVPKYIAELSVGGKWVALGDSLTAQGKYIPNTKKAFGFGSVVNLGVGGKKASGEDGMWKSDYLSQIPSDASLITIMCGTNDWAQSVTIGDFESTDTDEYCGALNAIIDYVSQTYPQIRFVIMCPPIGVYPNRAGWSEPWIENLNGNSMMDFAEAAYQVASNRGIACARIGQNTGWNDKNISTFVTFDGGYLHPNDAGGLRISDVLIGFLKSILPL